MTPQERNLRIAGRAVSPGLAVGRAFVYHERLTGVPEPREIGRHEVQEEVGRIERAIQTVLANLEVSARRIGERVDARLSTIFETHGAMLQDPALREEIRGEVEGELVNAEHALARVFRRWERRFHGMSEETQRERGDDMADLARRLLREMAGLETTPLEKMPNGRILVAQRLLPSDTVALPRRAVAGIVLEQGGPGSHAALLARGMGIPTVVQVLEATRRIADGDMLAVDALAGEVIVRPDLETRKQYRQRLQDRRTASAAADGRRREKALTLDGTHVPVLANVGCREDVAAAADAGADGVGLCRMEQYYLSCKVPPTAAELAAELREMFAPLAGRPITVRLLDLGGDKPLPFLKLPPEDNPFLGRRGIRLLLDFPDLITTQLQALLDLAGDHDVRILVPMVTLADEMASVRKRLNELVARAHLANSPPLGAMIETPAAALCAADLVRHADFLSVGTNDLTQYTMAAGRENPLVSDYFIEDHPAVLRLLRIVVDESGGAPVEVCGELAGRPGAAATLLGLGVHALSVAPPLVPAIKEAVRAVSLVRGRKQ